LYGIEPNSRPPTYDTWRELVHPDDRANAEQVVTRAFRDGDGGDRWLQSRGRSVRDAEGRATRLVGIVLDITKRKHAEQTLREREQNLRRFAEIAPVSIAMFDCEMRYLAASRRFRDDYSLGDQELLGRSHYEVFPEIPEEWRETHRRCLAGAVERSPGGAASAVRWHRAVDPLGGSALVSARRQHRRHRVVQRGDHRAQTVRAGAARKRGEAPVGPAGRPDRHVRVELSDRSEHMDSGAGWLISSWSPAAPRRSRAKDAAGRTTPLA
jgi:hypothetical protein